MHKEPDITIGDSAELIDEIYEKLPPPGPDKPRKVFPSNLHLTRAQEDALCLRAANRFQQLDEELGREQTRTDIDGTALFLNQRTDEKKEERLFMAKRLLYQHIAENDFSWRPLLMKNSIFAKSNLVVPLCRRICRQMAARAGNYFFGTNPWLAVEHVGLNDITMAKTLNNLVQAKLDENENQSRIQSAIPIAFEIGEAIIKTTTTRKASFYRHKETVAVDGNGLPLTASDGQPIRQDDEWIPADPNNPGGSKILKRDGTTEMPPMLQFQETMIDEEIIHYQGPDPKIVYFRDFLCPLNATDIQSADCICHVMDYSANQLAADYMTSPGESMDELKAAVEAIRNALNQESTRRSFDAMRPELGETTEPETPDPVMTIGEFYLRYDADGDGYMEDIMLVMDLASKTPIFYDYTAAVTDDGLRPFQIVRAKPVLNRWYGQGAIELFESYQSTVDLLVNRRNRAQSESGRVTLWRPQNTVEGDANPNLILNWGKTYTPREGKTPEDIINVVYLDDNKYDNLTDELQFFLQLAMNESGVQHANDNYVAGMDSAKLATGIKNIEKSGMEMFAVFISSLETGLNAASHAFVQCLYKHLDDEETFIYLDGDVPVELTVAARDVKALKYNARVTLSKYKAEQSLASAGQAIAVVRDYYTLTLPWSRLSDDEQARIDSTLLGIVQSGEGVKGQYFEHVVRRLGLERMQNGDLEA
ncbi:MAG: hypothetical protein KA004_05090 [Verrucomicrobiales bacterium]|nr:hypothetical protein [Verrucomicrobiales bacterium]